MNDVAKIFIGVEVWWMSRDSLLFDPFACGPNFFHADDSRSEEFPVEARQQLVEHHLHAPQP